jgi:putative MATE family efflux protein
MLAPAMPFVMVMFVANACLRGAGDTLTPAISMAIVSIVNMIFSAGLCYGWGPLPAWGFDGVAAGTVIAYITGGVIQSIVLLLGRGGIRLHLHRLRPHWHNMRRLLRIGIPTGVESSLQWGVNFALVFVINRMDVSSASGAAHNLAIRIESLSYLTGFGFAIAASTLVGQSLGRKDPVRAARCAWLAYAMGGSFMTLAGVGLIFFGRSASEFMSTDPAVIDLTTRCLFWAGFCQCGFAAAMVFGAALRGAGDTTRVMITTLSSLFGVRLVGVIILAKVFGLGLEAIWILLSAELMLRGGLLFAQFQTGKWKHVKV